MRLLPQFIKSDPEKLADYIAAIGRRLIAFDGRPSAGKTPLARDMARRLGCTAVDADKFLEQQQGAFVEKLRIADMRRTLRRCQGACIYCTARSSRRPGQQDRHVRKQE
jgi:hypothetical protein